MSLQSVRQFFAEHAPDIEIIELNQSTATVALAAAAHNVEPGQIAKTLSLKIKDKIVLIVLPAAGAIHSAVRIEPERMAQLTDATWVDVCL